ncbi:MAG: amino acid ABC transporter permease [Synergistaceae bacterium]|jgi:L-cystine transport system permease protein|nr:amino acid ABC transporter permease [Synergistaceae bacterium]
MGKLFDVALVFEYLPPILSRIPITLLIVAVAIFGGVLLGLLLALVRLYRVPVLNGAAIFYISFIRGTPVVIQLFIVFYGFPLLLSLIDININRWGKLNFVLVAYALNNAAFMAEIIRSAIASVPAGQTEAAWSVGLSGFQTLRRIVLPQAFLTAFPAFGTRVVNAMQDTSLAFTLGILDMLGQAQAIGIRTYHSLEGYVVVALIFIAASLLLEKAFAQAGKKLLPKEARRG